MKKSEAEVVREYAPIGDAPIHGVTFDGKLVWFATDDAIVAFDPEAEKVVRRLEVPANAGTAYDGKHLYQIARGEILVIQPADGRVVRKLPAPGKGQDSGMAWSDGYLWIGQYRESTIHKVDAKTGEVVKTLSSDRFVTGVSCVDGALWHGASDGGKPNELAASDPTEPLKRHCHCPSNTSPASRRPATGLLVRRREGEAWLVRKKNGSRASPARRARFRSAALVALAQPRRSR